MSVPAPPIITCAQWGARKPKVRPAVVGKPVRGIVHHTDGHHPEIANPANESRDEAIKYAQAIQHLHMDIRGWNDSGHNFLVCRNGMILQGRWGSVSAIERGRMVESAHCPGQNDQPGVEYEHLPIEPITMAQEVSGIHLWAWIFDRCGISPTALYGHHDFYNTDCPDTLYPLIRVWRGSIASALIHYGRGSAGHGGRLRTSLAVRGEIQRGGGLTRVQ